MLVGNDIVDLQDAAAAEKHRDSRFLERVLTTGERACVDGAENPSLVLWMLWAGKESLFKIARKAEPDLVFSPKDIAVFGEDCLASLRHCQSSGGNLGCSIFSRARNLAVRWDWNAGYVHCIAREDTGAAGTTERVELLGTIRNQGKKLSALEMDSVHSEESREARFLAKRILGERYPLRNLEIIRKRVASGFLPPAVHENGELVRDMDLSLSHDGRYVAAVVSSSAWIV